MRTWLQDPDKTEYQRAYAKINLTLDVGDTRPDGYHEVSMIMQNIRLWDEVRLSFAEGEGIELTCNLPFLGANEKNLAYRAAVRMRELFAIKGGLRMHLEKKIPISAGLAGGSADAAAVLRGLNRLYRLNLTKGHLMRIGAEIGSDVPYCVLGGTCTAKGRGEIVKRMSCSMMPAHVVLVKPNFGISTPWAYAQFDPAKVTRRPDEEAMQRAMLSGDLDAVGAEMVNLLEDAAFREYPILMEIRDDFRMLGASGAMMSGSGPTMYALFKEEEAARRAFLFCKRKYPYRYQVIFSRILTQETPKAVTT